MDRPLDTTDLYMVQPEQVRKFPRGLWKDDTLGHSHGPVVARELGTGYKVYNLQDACHAVRLFTSWRA